MKRRPVSWMLVCAMLVVVFARPAVAQAQTGSLYGRVSDPAGTPVAGVTVTLEPISGAAPRSIVTGQDGAYDFADLPDDIFRLRFTKAGFRSLLHTGVVVLPDVRRELNATLSPDPSAAPASGQAAAAAALEPGDVAVALETPFGRIVIAVDTAKAPITAANFLRYVDGGFYDGGRFHRATRPDNYTPSPPNRPMMEIIQGGISPARQSEGFDPIPLERTSVTGLRHVAGTVSMARGTAADTARSDFFILLDDQPSLDFGGMRFDDGQGGAAFGRVIEGMDVVRRIQQQPVQGQSLAPPVEITKAARYTPGARSSGWFETPR
jgi:peptidyl-prolyl cis-trans isomerase A (cyclophilin A)